MALTGSGIILIVITSLTTLTRCHRSLVKDSSLLKFTHHLYNASIFENSPPRTFVENHDRMGIFLFDSFWDIKYKIVAGDDDALFRAEQLTVGNFCFLRVKTRSSNSAVLNREVRDIYTLTIEATESTYDNRARTKVLIQVLDTNDLKPLFYPASYHVQIKDDTPIMSSLVRVSATDADIGSNADFYYSFTSRSHPFAVDPFTGVVTLIKRLNASHRDRYDLTVLAEDRTKKFGVQKFGNVATVVVTVQKVTENLTLTAARPRMNDGKIRVDIKVEPEEKNTQVGLVEEDHMKCFQIIPSVLNGGGFQLVSTKWIDWSQNPFGLNVSLQAKETSNPLLLTPVTRLHIPAQELKPLSFEKDQYQVILSEFAPPKTYVVRVSIQSNSQNVTYRFEEKTDASKFKISAKTGVIVTSHSLDFEKQARYELKITVNDGEAVTTVIVDILDENDNSPKFTMPSYQASLNENIPIGTSVLAVSAIDLDKDVNGFVTYSIANTADVPFSVDPLTGVISTLTEFDYELMKRWYHLRIWASDSGSPFSRASECSVTITMTNINDNVPMFEQVECNASIPRDFAVGENIVEVLALDLDELQQITYKIASGNDEGLFAIDPVSGIIKLATTIPQNYDKSKNPSFVLGIIATDGKFSAKPNIVTLHITDKGKDVSTVCKETGITRQLTEKLIESFKPSLSIKEEEYISDVHIMNRHSPKFSDGTPSSIDIKEDFALDRNVLQFNATDSDSGFNGKLVYVISSGNEDGCFTIDLNTGELKVICALDREQKEFYILNVTVFDLGLPQTSTWKFLAVSILDTNDNPPLFSQPIYVVHVPENIEVNKSIFRVSAEDLDQDDNGLFKFSLLTFTDLFRIDEVTGLVTVVGHLDRETSLKYDLKIEARDQAKEDPQLFSFTELVVVLEDVNDNPPKFVPTLYRIKVPEDAPLGTVLIWVESFDLDLNSGGTISYNLKNKDAVPFFLDFSTGCLTLEHELDFEKQPFYNVTVQAVDHGKPQSLSSLCFIEVEVLDVNENLNRPLFNLFVYNATVMEDVKIGTSVLTLTATDNDLGRDGFVRYYIHDGSGLGVFTIDEETGLIRTTGLLDRETQSHYWLTVYAKDLGSIPLVSWTEVYLEVQDVNDNPPELLQPIYFGSVNENLPKDQSVLKVSATDMDKSSEGKLTFQILDSQRIYFTIDHKSGVISTLAPLDREQKAEHIIEVRVSDNGAPSLSSTATVVIEVLDENDNSPQFSHKLFQVKLPERQSTAEPQEIYRMVARDDDVGPNGLITYSLEDNPGDRFEIHPESGLVKAQGEFVRGNYSILTIKAMDQGNPPRISKARLHVEWLPRPEPSSEVLAFDEPPFNYVVMETDPVTDMVGIIRTEISKSLLFFDIIGDDEEQDFYIEKNTGSIIKARRLDAGRKSHYNLTVNVTDGYQVITTQAHIQVVDINEHRPMFLKSLYEVRVPEDTSPLKEILHVSAQDADGNSGLFYSIHTSLNPDSLQYFHMEQRSGVLITKEKLDYESIPTHTLIVMVRDEKIPIKKNFAKVIVHVEDCNDQFPSFLKTRYEATISNLAGTGTEVLTVKALDRDTGSNADIVYSFHSGGDVDGAFQIEPDTGSIRVSGDSDGLSQEHYHLTVKATDQGFPQRSALCPVTITVKLSESTAPKFSNEKYITEISEAINPGSAVLSVSASCPSSVQYRINEGDPNGTFQININSGLLSVKKAIDFEHHPSYRLQVRATNTAGVSADAVVSVLVIDENDNIPVFRQDTYYGQISESAPINSMVIGDNNAPLVIKAFDADKDSNGLLVFWIVEPAAQKVFKVDSNTGTIFLNSSTVDFESVNEYVFSVQVRDSGEPSLSASEPCKVKIRILDLNDCAPKFSLPVYETSLALPVFEDMKVTQVTAHDADSTVTYMFSDLGHKTVFKLNTSTGLISVRNSSELAMNNYYELHIAASDGLYKDSAIVKINITNRTKTSLSFENRMPRVTVLENTSSQKILAVLRVKGSFLNEPLQYTVLNPVDKFTVIPSSGVLQTTGMPFDREEQGEYDVVMEVRDLRNPPRVDVTHVKVYVDDVNDNAPDIQNLPNTLILSEETEAGVVLFQVLATDKDFRENGSVIYSLEEDFNLFRIDPDHGNLSLSRSLDFEFLNRYVLTVLASDKGKPSLSTAGVLNIEVQNRSNPIFQSIFYPLKLTENIAPSTTILHVQARNPEGYHLIYNLMEDNSSNLFHIDFKTGVLSVTDFLDFETQTKHVLTVRATDSVTGNFAEATVEIDIEDVNDNAPVFQNYTYSTNVFEGLPVGTSVLLVSASDRDSGSNSDLTYQLEPTEFFEIDPVSGSLVTLKILDYESTKEFSLKVKATDKGTPALSGNAIISVNVEDVNDNPPVFTDTSYRASLDESATCGHIVIKVQASDPDGNNELQYKILSGNEGRHFAINESSGLISFSNACKRNMDPFYNLTVAVSDGVFRKTAPVNIDMTNGNKHSPYFSQHIYEADLAENAEVGTRVIRLAAIDPDDGPYGSVDYTIINKLADEKFSINRDGQIVTSQSLDRENPSQRVIAIKVMAKDGGGRVGFCTVKIILTDENDNIPQFKASEYQVSIQSTVNKGSPVIQILAYDADEGKNADVTYTVEEAEEVTEDIIEVNPFTGVVSIKESLVGKENKIFNFKVKARDGGIPFYNSSVPLQVKVVPPEVPLPQFTEPLYTFSASEDLSIGYEIGAVKADSDAPLIYSLVNGNTVDSNKDQVFAVDKDSGAVVVQKNIDHEKTKMYKIDVIAQGNHNGSDLASLVSVHIEVQDVNDNKPMFEADPYKAFLAENMPSGTTVIQVTATDADSNLNGEVSYALEPESEDSRSVFAIDSQTGWITTLKEADSEAKQLHRFYVVASDHGDAIKMTSSVLVEVTITDENDNPPRFTEEVYQGSIFENSRAGERIITLTTADQDVSADSRDIMCYITDGDPLGQFSVTAEGDEWTIISKSPLDREEQDKYTLQIMATDGKFQTSANVEVHVLDINDNSPLCEQVLYTESVMENSPPSLFILKILASDPDIGTNGQVTFTLHGPKADKFHLDSKTGELFTLAILDREREAEYDLVVKATDGGGRSCHSDVMLLVQDMNDNPPLFSTNHYEVTVFDNTTIRTPIAVIYAKDPDTGINSEVRYALQGADSGFFSLDEISGILRLEITLADETKSTYEMKVKATDRGLPHHLFSVATITVHVVTLSDYQPLFLTPEFFVAIPESLQIGSEVISMSVFTKDGTESDPVQYSIISGNEGGRFQINPVTGLLWVNATLDFEFCREYYLSVEGARGKPFLADIASVIINITDVNDNPPVFKNVSYRSVIAEDILPGDMVLQVTALDRDSPPNNFIIYSIVNGDPKQQFSIDSRTGHIKVYSMLDREETQHYTLTVQASDEGVPPLSAAVQVTVTVSDINDNPPMFSQINHNLAVQEGEAVGSGILQLLVTDRDTPKNGPPFSFHIVSGNEDRRFQVDQGGLLSISSPLMRRGKPQHLLKIQVTDSGNPPLSSICVVNMNITEMSKYPPIVTPLEVFITTSGGTLMKRVIGKLHATDQDPQDILSYKLVSDAPNRGLFSVDTADGKILVEKDLEPGLFKLNVSVTDGKFSVWAGVKVHVWAATRQALDQGFTLQLAGLSAEEFVADHWRGLQRSLGLELNIPRHELHIASLQQQPDSVNTEVLLIRRGLDGSVQPVPAQRLRSVLSTMEDTLGLNVLRLKHDGCVGAGCPPRGCRNSVVIQAGRMSNYATARTNFITPQHSWESVCSCNGSALRFDGQGYLKYLYQTQEDNQNFHLSLRLKTFVAEGTVMSSNASDWGTLELVDKELRFRYRCGDLLPASLRVTNHPVSDGQWHQVSLEVNGTILRLTIDASHTKSIILPQPCRFTQFGGAVILASSNPSTDAQQLGFTGCLESLELNGERVQGEDRTAGAGLQSGKLFGIYQCCSDVKICASNPCENGGTCVEDSDEEFHCICPLSYVGSRCESSWMGNPCAIQPCAYGSCVPNNQGYICNCFDQIAGNRCRIDPVDSCSPNPCLSGFSCSVSRTAIHCERTFSLPYVEIAELCAGIVAAILVVLAFVCIRRRYINHKKQKTNCVQDSNGYFRTMPQNIAKEVEISSPMETRNLNVSMNDQDHSLFRSLKSHEQRELGPQVGPRSQKPQGPVICSVAPNLPPAPSSCSDNDSIRKNNWEHDYEVYPGDLDYYGRPSVPQFDIVESTYSSTSTESRRNSRFGGFPFPIDRADRRAPLPPCYSNQNLDDFLGPDGLPLPSAQCPNEYTALSYYPTQHTRSLDNVSNGYKRLSVRLSVAQPSYAEGAGSSRPASSRRTTRSYAGSDMVESDYGSCEEVMF